jgi:hypothetical protein
LQSARYIGQLPDIVGANLPVKVSCFIFMISGQPPEISANAEVNDVFWVSLTDLRDRERHTLSTVRFSETSMQVPAIILPQPGKPVLWGITYRLIMYLLEENRERREYW